MNFYIAYLVRTVKDNNYTFESKYETKPDRYYSFRLAKITTEEYLLLKLKYKIELNNIPPSDDVTVEILDWGHTHNEEILYCELLQNLR